MAIDACDVVLIDEGKVKRVRSALRGDLAVQHLGDFFKVIGDTTRLRIILALAMEELCVCDLAAITGVSPSAVSHQLRILRGARFVRYRRDGKVVYYSLVDHHIQHLLDDALNHLEEKR